MNRKETGMPSPRGYEEDIRWYQYLPEHATAEERNEVIAVRALDSALDVLVELRSALSEVQSLVYGVQVSLVVLEDVLALFQGCEAAMEATSSIRDLLRGRAAAAARSAARQRARHGGPTSS